eukprot:4129-Heterococcus_DN1.PRE.2
MGITRAMCMGASVVSAVTLRSIGMSDATSGSDKTMCCEHTLAWLVSFCGACVPDYYVADTHATADHN